MLNIEMTDDQHKLVIASLAVVGLVIAYNMLDCTSQFEHEDWTPVLILYEDLDPLGHIERWGLYTQYGEIGVILGVVVPLCLFAVAAYMALRLSLRDGP
jgi:hypothetical protein